MKRAPLSKDVVEILRGPEPEWKNRLIRNDRGAPKALLANCITALRHAPEFQDLLAYNSFSMSVAVQKTTPWGTVAGAPWTDNQDRLVTEWFQTQGIHVGVEVAAQGVQTVAEEHSFHPVRDWLNALAWDGVPRIATWLKDHLGVQDSDYSRAVGERWLISAVARVFKPGCKADCCLIFEGAQGIGKSKASQVLAGEHFTDEIAEPGSKDAALQTMGAWIIEFAELDSMSRSEVGSIKAFMSRSTDRFRPPYGRRVIEAPRQCVFVGTVNHSDYLRDETGARRFWPVACGFINIPGLTRDRDQLWAEAVVGFKAGKSWWLDSTELIGVAAAEQANRFEGDPWEEMIAAFTESRPDISIDQILGSCLEKPKAQWSQVDKNRVARTLRSLGWERYKQRYGEQFEWRYRRAV